MTKDPYLSALLGVATGDAIGVPVEFMSRQRLQSDPVTGVRGHGSHNQPPGTFSDDTSLTLCLADAMARGFSLNRLADNCIAWMTKNFWAARGELFDIGITTREAITRLAKGYQPELAGGFEESENGNGSLMRILPLVFHIRNLPVEERYMLTKQVSSLTHGHIRAVVACFYYLEYSRLLLAGADKFDAYQQLQTAIPSFLEQKEINPAETGLFGRLLQGNIWEVKEEEIEGSGYVLHSIEASIWCLLTTDTYESAVLKAVNLGRDTDTTGAITGGIAALYYGHEQIPAPWLEVLARRKDIEALAGKLKKIYG